MTIDTLINARWVVPVQPEGIVLDHHSVAIKDGLIIDLLPTADATKKYTPQDIIERPDHVLMPGLINAHTHTPMTLLRGYADDIPLMQWLNEHIWPIEGRFVSEEFVRDGSQLAFAEMLQGGTTCFNDMYFFPEITARSASQCGIRSMVGMIVIDFPSAWANDWEEYLNKGLAFHDDFRDDPLVQTAFAPHAPYSVSDEPLQRIRTLSDELDIPIHIHLHETNDEIEQGAEHYGKRPLQRMSELGLLSPNLMAVHMTHCHDDEFKPFAESGASIIHCPESNQKLASGYCQVQRWLDLGVNVGLGTDGAASNNDLDMLSEARSAALLGKAVSQDATATSAIKALHMATMGGAHALGMADQIGSIEVGKAADLACVSLAEPKCQPVYHPISQLIYTCSADQVTDTWVGGKHLYRDGQLTTLDLADVLDRARNWQTRISAAALS